MTKQETMQILVVIQTAYPNYKPNDKTLAIDLWNTMLGSYDYHAVLLALQAYIATDTSGFAPAIGQIIGKLNEIRQNNADLLTGMEAWSMVSKALRNGGYHYSEEFQKLPEDVQRAVGSAEMLHVWAMDPDFNESVVMSQFLKSYQTATDQRREREKLPANIRALIEDTTGRMK
ncbi:MAG: hypothetical protein LUD72_06960 [Bacteroidales bacterium]|nr:hypothetical protein [Bacteroidales bacterium]